MTAGSLVEWVTFAAPLRAVDRLQVTRRDGGLSIVARVLVDAQDPNLRGHFPGRPIYPGVFVVETLTQAMALALGGRVVLRELTSIRFLAAVLGGDELELVLEVTARTPDSWQVSGVGWRLDGTVTTRLRATFDRGGTP